MAAEPQERRVYSCDYCVLYACLWVGRAYASMHVYKWRYGDTLCREETMGMYQLTTLS